MKPRWVALAPLVVVVVVMVACGSSIPTAAPASPVATSTPSLAPGSTSSGPSAISGLEAPTSEPLHSVRIPEVPCPTIFGRPSETMPPTPGEMTATVTAEVAALVTYYGNGTLTLLGPKGWQCTATVGVDGSAHMAITPPGQAPRSGSPLPDDQAITARTAGTCIGCVASMACGLFPEARNLQAQPGLTCLTTAPIGEQVTRPRPRSAVFEDAPGVTGTGEPSGGRYRALGFLVFDPGTAAGGTNANAPSALKETCTLPDSLAQICDEIVEGIGHG